MTSQSITPGTLVKVTGTLDTIGLERVIRFGDVIGIGSGSLKPLGMNTRFVTGTAADHGLRTIPLLVKVCGRVSARGDSGWFTLDDGSGKVDSAGNPGVKVGANVMVTGISSFETVSGATYPLIRVRAICDIQPAE